MSPCFNPQSLKIRQATEADIPRMREIAIAAWRPIYEGFRKAGGDEFFFLQNPDWKTEKAGQVENHFRDHPEWTLVTEYSGRPVGFITFRLNNRTKTAEIGNNGIDPDFQGHGLGTNQYRHVLRLLKEKGMQYAVVGTGLDGAHAAARAAYEKVGFKPLHESIKYFVKL